MTNNLREAAIWCAENLKRVPASGLKIFFIPMLCYLPAFFLIRESYSENRLLSGSQKRQIAEEVKETLENQRPGNYPLTDLQKKQTEEEIKKALDSRLKENDKNNQRAIAQAQTSILAKGYIDGRIQEEVQEKIRNQIGKVIYLDKLLFL
jgi:hypothetical protein